MNYIIYMDLFWVINTAMNIILLWLLGKIRRHKIRWIPLLVGGMIGGFGACVFIYSTKIPIFVSFLLQNIVLVYGMIRMSYKQKSKKDSFFDIVLFYALGITVNGGISTILNRTVPYLQNKSRVSMREVISIGIVCSVALLFFWRRWTQIRTEEKNLYDIVMKNADLCCRGRGLLDTGNQLREPVTRKPVVVAEYDTVKSLFTEELQKAILQFGTKEMNVVYPIKWIPYHSLGNSNGYMPGVYIDEMQIKTEEEEKTVGGVLLGIVFESVSTRKQYQFILHEQYVIES